MPVNCARTSANRREGPRVATRGDRSSFSRERRKNARRTAERAGDGRSEAEGSIAKQQARRELETLQELILNSRRKFVGLAYSVLRNHEDAEDAVQDALVSAFRHLRGFEGRSALTTWFTRIVLNAALMIRRKRKPGRVESLPEAGTTDEMSWVERIPDEHPDPEVMFAEKETLESIDILLGKMSPILRQAFVLTHYEEISNEEGGALLGISSGTFKSRVFRARQDLMNQAERKFVAPIRRATAVPFSAREGDFAFAGALAAGGQ
jgi:RNA polymerase sigma-70 factor (ECF subfamily)